MSCPVLIKKAFEFLCVISFIVGLLLTLYTPALPKTNEILSDIKEKEPQQNPIAYTPIRQTIYQYTYMIEPKFSYELSGLVVSVYDADNWLDYTHRQDPGNIKDICVVWGKNIENGAYRKVQYASGEFTCFYRWKNDVGFSSAHISNNHLIPQNERIAGLIKTVQPGDQIRLRGLLSNYQIWDRNGTMLYRRGTSISRTDTGDGACETIYVTDIEILKKDSRLQGYVRRYSWWTSIASLVLWTLFSGAVAF